MTERRLQLSLRALFGGAFSVELAPVPRATFEGRSLRLPASAEGGFSALDLARATHAALHAVFSPAPLEPGQLRPVQRALVGVLEDARVEQLALSRFPGLRALWAPFHVAGPGDGESAPALLGRLARALFDSTYRDPNAWVQRAASAFSTMAPAGTRALRELASVLGNELGQLRLPFDPAAPSHEPSYRDDHRGLFRPEPQPAQASQEATEAARSVGALGEATRRGEEPGSAAITRWYPEWDYVIERERPNHCAIREEPRSPRAPVDVPGALRRRVKAAARRAHERARPLRRCADGLELDLAAVVSDAAQRARGAGVEGRLYVGRRRRRFASSTVLLLDLSASLQEDELRLLQTASVALAAGLPRGAELAIDGFCSRGREDVRYERFKPFEAPAPRLAPERAVSGSTRLGAALRHATELLSERRAGRKVLLVLSDGEPADVDVFDERYLLEDARRAVDAARERGVRVVTWCLRPRRGPAPRRALGWPGAVSFGRLGDLPRHVLHAYSLRRSGRSGEP